MSRIPTPVTEQTPEKSQPLLAAVQKQLGTVANLFRIVAMLDDAQITASRSGASNDVKADGAVRFAVKLARGRGHASDADIGALKQTRCPNAEIVEIIGHVALNTFTNDVNEALKTEIDFPVVTVRIAAAA